MLLEELESSSAWSGILARINQSGQYLRQAINQVFASTNNARAQALPPPTQLELRRLLTSIVEDSKGLQQEMPPEARADLVKIQSAAEQMLMLIDLSTSEGIDEGLPPPVSYSPVLTSPASLASRESLKPEQKGQGRVLVVDDHPTNRDLLARRLKLHGLSVMLAEDGRQALAKLENIDFDLVLLDVMMPEMDGFELLNIIKTRTEFRDIPVIMISALDQLDSVVRCIELGAEDYLTKPFNPIFLKARVGACLEKKYLRDQELEYLKQVAKLTEAAAAVETSSFDPASLEAVAQRQDALGHLAQVFQRMAAEVYGREQRLQQQIRQLKIEVDQEKRSRQVAEITETDFFQQLERKADTMRRKIKEA